MENKTDKQLLQHYLMREFFRYVRDNGVRHGRGMRLKPGDDYKFTNTKNPNEKQVPDQLWRTLILNCLTRIDSN